MKIRIKGDTVRYRLTRPEVEDFAVNGIIKEETHFNSKTLTYVLQKSNDSRIRIDFTDDTITVLMPEIMAEEWTATERVGFENDQDSPAVYIEKDFKCLDNVDEDQSDNYPNPLAEYPDEQNK